MANDSNSLNIPEPTTIIEYRVTKKFPFVSIVDEAFALKPFRLQPLPRKNDHNLEKLISDCLVQYRFSKTASGY